MLEYKMLHACMNEFLNLKYILEYNNPLRQAQSLFYPSAFLFHAVVHDSILKEKNISSIQLI